MSTKEASRLMVLTLLETGAINQKEAGRRMDVTPRQVRRMMKRYKAEGVSGLISRKRGRASNRKLSDEAIIEAMDLIRLNYLDFGSTLAAEKLREVHHELSNGKHRLLDCAWIGPICDHEAGGLRMGERTHERADNRCDRFRQNLPSLCTGKQSLP